MFFSGYKNIKDELFGVQLLHLSNIPIATFDTYKSKHFPILARWVFLFAKLYKYQKCGLKIVGSTLRGRKILSEKNFAMVHTSWY